MFRTNKRRVKQLLGIALAMGLVACTGGNENYEHQKVSKKIKEKIGIASWYGPGFEQQKTASGDTYSSKKMTAASTSLPLGTKAVVTNLENGKKAEVLINDRGPHVPGRIIDLSHSAAKKLDFVEDGTVKVKVAVKAPPKN